MNETPRANRIHVAFFGLRNAGKSTLVNAFTRQNLAIVSETPGTTTDPVSKAMEILPLGPCLVTDTAGLDDVGELGAQRVRKTLDVLATTDVAVWVHGDATSSSLRTEQPDHYQDFLDACRTRHVAVLEYRRGESVDALREKIAALRIVDDTPGLLDGLVQTGDRVVCVCPIDASAPKGRLILPQVQVIRAALDLHATCHVCQVEELSALLSFCTLQSESIKRQSEGHTLQSESIKRQSEAHTLQSESIKRQSEAHTLQSESIKRQSEAHTLQFAICNLQSENSRTVIITDSQAFGEVKEVMRRETRDANSPTYLLTSFSILFARQKGDLNAYVEGLAALRALKDGDTVLVAEGCTHHRQCNDIGTVKIPKALEKLSGRKLDFTFASGGDFWARSGDVRRETREDERQETKDPQSNNQAIKQSNVSLIVQCGGCMLTRREVLRRIGVSRDAGIPIVNYGMVLAAANGIDVDSVVSCLSPSGSCLASLVSRPGQGEDAKCEMRDMNGEGGRREAVKI